MNNIKQSIQNLQLAKALLMQVETVPFGHIASVLFDIVDELQHIQKSYERTLAITEEGKKEGGKNV